MNGHKKLSEICRRLATMFSPDKIILFGSFAQGKITKDSDLDLLVIKDCKGREVDEAVEMRLAVATDVPMDILVRSPRTLKQRLARGDPFIRNVLRCGKVLYEAPHKRVG